MSTSIIESLVEEKCFEGISGKVTVEDLATDIDNGFIWSIALVKRELVEKGVKAGRIDEDNLSRWEDYDEENRYLMAHAKEEFGF